MDGLTHASSMIAMVSLAIQIIDSVDKLQGYLKPLRNASEISRDTILYLESLRISLQIVLVRSDYSAENLEVLQGFLLAINKIITDLSTFKSQGDARHLSFVGKTSRMKSMQHSLKSSITSLNRYMTLLNSESTQHNDRTMSDLDEQNWSEIPGMLDNGTTLISFLTPPNTL